jgi:hypothetical protein
VIIPEGGEKLAALDRALKKASERDLAKQLDKGVRRPLQELIPKLPASALATLPKRGGLAAQIAASKIGVRRYNAGRYPGVRLVARNAYGLARKDRGKLRHPVFADQSQTRDEWTWVDQDIRPGWFSNVTEPERPRLARELEAAIDAVARQIEIEIEGA